MRFGLVGVPSLLLFHNGKVAAKFNDSDPTINGFVSFVTKMTGLNPEKEPALTEKDYNEPLSLQPDQQFDFILLFSWLFVITCSCYLFSKSVLYKRMAESIRNTWREAEAQHEHLD